MKLGTPATRFLDIQGASQYTGISVTTLYAWVVSGRFPIKLGRLLTLLPLKLNEWIRPQSIMLMPRR